MWLLPFLIVITAVVLSIPLSRYFAWIMEGRYHAPGLLAWFERRLNSGAQDWKQYTVALLVFNTVLFVYGYIVLSIQPWMPLNPRGLGMLAPSMANPEKIWSIALPRHTAAMIPQGTPAKSCSAC